MWFLNHLVCLIILAEIQIWVASKVIHLAYTKSLWNQLQKFMIVDITYIMRLQIEDICIRHLDLVAFGTSKSERFGCLKRCYQKSRQQHHVEPRIHSLGLCFSAVNQTTLSTMLWPDASQQVSVDDRKGAGGLYGRSTYKEQWYEDGCGGFVVSVV